MPFAGNVTALDLVPVSPNTSVIRTAAVVRSAYRMLTVIDLVLASTTNARIHVLVPVASMPSVAF